jgi:hypothetical protein
MSWENSKNNNIANSLDKYHKELSEEAKRKISQNIKSGIKN